MQINSWEKLQNKDLSGVKNENLEEIIKNTKNTNKLFDATQQDATNMDFIEISNKASTSKTQTTDNQVKDTSYQAKTDGNNHVIE